MFKSIIMRDDVGLLFVGLALLFLIAILYGHQNREHFSDEANAWETIQREVEADLSTFLVFDVSTFRKNTADQTKFFALVDGNLNDAQKAQKAAAQVAAAATKVTTSDIFNTGIDSSWEFITAAAPSAQQLVYQMLQLGVNLTSPRELENPAGEAPFFKKLKPYFKGKFDLDKPFDTRMALLDAMYAMIIANNKKGSFGFGEAPSNASDEIKADWKILFLMRLPDRYIYPTAKGMLQAAARAYMSSPYIGLLNAKAMVRTGSESVLSSFFGN